MCGIVGYAGYRSCSPLLLRGLARLEYRGYDSAGLALLDDDGIDRIRAVGNLESLLRSRGGTRPRRPASRTRAGRPTGR